MKLYNRTQRISRYDGPRTESRFSFPWGYDLRQTLGGSFTARRSLLATEFVLLDAEEEDSAVCILAGHSGGLTGRSYEALFATEDGCTLPVAVFLLWHVAANRRRAYRAGI